MSLFDPENIPTISYFYFECKRCGERWFSTFCQCPRCKRVRKFRILSEEEAHDQLMQNFLADKIHYVMLIEEESK